MSIGISYLKSTCKTIHFKRWKFYYLIPLWDLKINLLYQYSYSSFLSSEFVITIKVCKDLFRIFTRATTKLPFIRDFAVSVFILQVNEFYCI